MLEKITRREFVGFVKKSLYVLSGNIISGNIISLNCGKNLIAPDTEAPIARIKADKTEDYAPLTVNFDGGGSTDNDKITSYSWNFGDGSTGLGKTVSHTYGALQKTAFKINDSVFVFEDGIWKSYSPLKPDFLNTLKKNDIPNSLLKTEIYGKFTAELTAEDANKNIGKATIDIFVNELMPNSLPSEYYGKVNNGNVVDNLNVEGLINNVNYARLSKTKNGYYNIIIPADNPGTVKTIEGGKEGDKIQVKIDGKNASPLLDFKSGSIDLVNLTY